MTKRDKTDRILRSLRARPHNVVPIATDMILPNHSGIQSNRDFDQNTFWQRNGSILSPKTAGDDIETTGAVQGNKLKAIQPAETSTAQSMVGVNSNMGLFFEYPYNFSNRDYGGDIFLRLGSSTKYGRWFFDGGTSGNTYQDNRMSGKYVWQAWGTQKMELTSSGHLTLAGNIKGAGFKSSDGSAGITQSETGVTDFDIVIKNGLITSFTKNN